MHLLHVVPVDGHATTLNTAALLRQLGHTVQTVRATPRSPRGLVGLGPDSAVVIDALHDPQAAKLFARDLARLAVDVPVLVVVNAGQLGSLSAQWAVDDFLLTSAGPREWERRLVIAAHRRRNRVGAAVRRLGELTLDAEALSLRLDGREIALTRTEHRVLELLFANPDVVFARDAILTHGWGGVQYDVRNIDALICRLRHKLGRARDVIQTVRGVGYRAVSTPSARPVEGVGRVA